MEKYGVEIDPQRLGLLQQEATLMEKLSKAQNVKTASESANYNKLCQELSGVRELLAKIDRGKYPSGLND
jgi:ABC-type lipoprotein export system ATPase subunit